jgi:hypothetical protein
MTNQKVQLKEMFFDDYFRVEKQRLGTWKSYDRNGTPIITSLTHEACIAATRQYLKWKQEGFPETQSHSGVVDGKL